MLQPVPALVMHFTRVENLAGIIEMGLLSDTAARQARATRIEIGHPAIKDQRRRRLVPLSPGGMVSDYVPFYFAPRSPMLFVIDQGAVPGYDGGCERVIYLVSSLENLASAGIDVLVTDRNAALGYAAFARGDADLDHHIDWALMRERMWRNTPDHPDRKERRMAEALVPRAVPWAAVLGVVAKTESVASEAHRVIAARGAATPVSVRPHWYF